MFDNNLLNGLIIDLIIIAFKLDEKFLESYYNLKDTRNKQQKFLSFFLFPTLIFILANFIYTIIFIVCTDYNRWIWINISS